MLGYWIRKLMRRGLESMADGLVNDPLAVDDRNMKDVEVDMPAHAIQEELRISEMGEFCIALAGSVEKGFSLEEGVRMGQRAADMRTGKHSLLHFHLWENADRCHELQVRMGKVASDRVAMHFMADDLGAGKVVAALNAAKGI